MNLETRTRANPPSSVEGDPVAASEAAAPSAAVEPEKKDLPQTPPSRGSVFWNEYVKPFLILALVLFAFRSSVADWNDVPTGSMKPTVLEGDRIFVNKLAYDLKFPFTTWRLARWSKPEKGEIVIFYQPGPGTRMVKRIVGVPGDKVEVRNNRLIINDKPLEYGPLDESVTLGLNAAERDFSQFFTETLGEYPHAVMLDSGYPGTPHYGPRVLKEGEYFVMGDNRNNSEDSRSWGIVPEDNILGRSSRVVLSLDRNNWYAPRFGRFFQSLP